MIWQEIQTELARAGKVVQEAQLYRYLRACEIRPMGVRQRPQNYPADSARRILAHLGINGHDALVSLKKLRAERSQTTNHKPKVNV